MNTPLFITFEGGEGAGKTTLIRRLEAELNKQNCPTVLTREPGGCSLGEQIRLLLLTHDHATPITPKAELLLFLAARAQHLEEVIRPALASGTSVLCDRFNDSSVAYQGIARGLGQDFVQKLCNQFCQNTQPNLTFFLDIDPEIGMNRARRTRRIIDRLENETVEFHEKVRQGFLKLAQENRNRIVVIDASLPFEQVFEKAWAILQQRLPTNV